MLRTCPPRHLPTCTIITPFTTMTKRENVWDYPRPPACEPTSRRLRVELDGVVIADTVNAHRVLETSHPPTYYIPIEDVKKEYLVSNSRQTFCEWKGAARYYDVKVNNNIVPSRVWYYPSPSPRFAAIANSVSFYASPFKCFVDDEEVVPQPGDFYGGWMTSDIDGGKKGVKGGPGTFGW
ncbi:hypothetical protein BC829DRAFT_396803 [Chytridium lagenaria]|nr:hypothetical protein BC829DRAFT_396803 [Chytridium lagenaria]